MKTVITQNVPTLLFTLLKTMNQHLLGSSKAPTCSALFTDSHFLSHSGSVPHMDPGYASRRNDYEYVRLKNEPFNGSFQKLSIFWRDERLEFLRAFSDYCIGVESERASKP